MDWWFVLGTIPFPVQWNSGKRAKIFWFELLLLAFFYGVCVHGTDFLLT